MSVLYFEFFFFIYDKELFVRKKKELNIKQQILTNIFNSLVADHIMSETRAVS
jgi:hypothetical protein